MFRRLLGGVFREQNAEIVRWSAAQRGHSDDESGKDIIHGDVVISVSAPSFGADKISVYIVVSNLGHKALGFGAAGIGLVLDTREHRSTVTCRALVEKQRGNRRINIYDERPSQNLIVDVGEGGLGRGVQFVAEFESAPRPDRVDLAIQANRIMAAPIVFHFPFELSTDPKNP